jgi:hypothetical protein
MKIYALRSFETPEKIKHTTIFKNQGMTLINLDFFSFFLYLKAKFNPLRVNYITNNT